MKKKPPDKILLAMAWYKPEQWQQLLEVSADRAKLEPSYSEWERNAYQAMKDFKAAGRKMIIRKVLIDIDELVEWCRERNRTIDGEARSEFALWKWRKEHAL